MNLRNGYVFVVDTDSYSGNFEREMTAHLTGHVGECEVGADLVDENIERIFSNITQVSDDNGCWRPCEIYPTPGIYNNGMGFNYVIGEEEQAIAKYIESTESYYKPLIKQREDYKIRLTNGEVISTWTIEACDREIKSYNDKIDNAKNTTKETLGKHPAYQSVAIYFDSKPTDEQISLMKERATTFNETALENCERYSILSKESNVKVTGFRLIKVETTVVETEIAI